MEENRVKNATGLLVIGGSAGSLQVILEFIPFIKQTLSFPILLVLHRKPSPDSTLAELLSFKTRLPVKEAEEKEELLPGNIYIAPAEYHVLIEDDHTITLDASEKINYSRPSIDVSFKSAADVYRGQLVAVLLSGANADGADGLQYVQALGGTTVVQNPATAEVGLMPQLALNQAATNYIFNSNQLAGFINNL
jgi:two-component system chemotaxis response regulator CheB